MPSTINADNGAISGSAGVKTTADSSGVLDLQTNGTTRLTIDTSGNLGLGVTPTNNTFGKTIQNGQAAVWVSETASNRFWLGSNWYFSGGDKYINNGFATLYSQQNGQHQWLNAASGTAGNAISFTQAMTLDSLGCLGLGTTSPFNPVANNTLIAQEISGSSYGGLYVSANSATVRGQFFANNVGSYVEVGARTNHPFVFLTNNTERARITSGGLFLLNTTTTLRYADAILQSKVVDGWAGTFQHEGTSAQNGALSCVVENTNGRLIRFQYQATEVGAITTNGTNTTYGTGSDVRLKKDIVPAPDAGADVDAINIVSFKWKSNGSETKYGVVAQELVNVSPEAVQKGDDSEDVVAAWGVDYSKLVPMLVKEIQSLRVRSAALEAEVAALKAR